MSPWWPRCHFETCGPLFLNSFGLIISILNKAQGVNLGFHNSHRVDAVDVAKKFSGSPHVSLLSLGWSEEDIYVLHCITTVTVLLLHFHTSALSSEMLHCYTDVCHFSPQAKCTVLYSFQDTALPWVWKTAKVKLDFLLLHLILCTSCTTTDCARLCAISLRADTWLQKLPPLVKAKASQ